MTDTSASGGMITPALVQLDVALGADKTEVIRALAARVQHAGRTADPDQLVSDALARESTSATGLPGGIAIPHCRTPAVDEPTLAFARLSPPVDFGAKDGPADLAFLIAAPAGGDATHLKVLTQLARALVKKDFTGGLRDAETPEEVVELVNGVVSLPPAAKPAPASGTPHPTEGSTPPASSPGNPHAAPAEAGTGTTSATGSGGATAVGSTAVGAAAGAGVAAASTSSSGSNGSAGSASHGSAGAATGTPSAVPDQGGGGRRRIVAVTACPTGIAHTYMAAEALEAAAARAGVDIDVETQGSAGSTPLPRETIAAADAAIFAVDVGVRDRSRFAGKPLVASGVKRPIDEADTMIAEALRYADDPNAPRVEGAGGGAGDGTQHSTGGGGESWGARIRRVLMTGVSYMIPFVAAGGLLIALSFLLGGYEIVTPGNDIAVNNSLFNLPNLQDAELDHAAFNSPLLAYLGAVLFTLGGAAFGFLVPALAGYIAYAIADRPGIAPGFVMGAIANTLNSGFIGGIIGGVLAGIVAHWIANWKVPTWMRGLMPVVVIPLLATLISGAIMIIVLGKPLGQLMKGLTDGLNSLSGGSIIILGVVLGLMMAFDMGGPLNKTAYAFATGGLTTAAVATTDAPQLKIMAAVMLSGMVPPLALALATVVRKRLFTEPERENGKAAWLMGASFITEGAIPFAAADPLRVIPAIMAGSAVTGGLSMALDVTLKAPHGGIFVFFAVGNLLGFLISLVAGVLVAAALVVVLKSMGKPDPEVEAESANDPALATV